MSSSFSAANATNGCLDRGTVEAFQTTNGVFAALGCVPCVVSVIVILATKKYKECFKRLVLYLSIVSLLSSIIGGLEAIDLTHSSQATQRNACQAFGFLANYLAYCKSCLTCSICINAFAFARYHRQLQNQRLETVVVLLAILLVPAMLSWEHLYLHDGTWCATGVYRLTDGSTCTPLALPVPGRGLGIGLATAPHIALYALSAALVASVMCLVCRKAAMGLPVPKRPSCFNLMPVCPMLLYSTLLCFDYTAAMAARAVVNDPIANHSYTTGIVVVMAFYHLSNVLVPLMLCHNQSEILGMVEPTRSGNTDWRTRGSTNSWRHDSIDSTSSARQEISVTHERSLLCDKRSSFAV